MTALPAPPIGHRRLLPWLLLAAVAVLFLLHVDRRAFLGDDACISFRYARHWAEGHGPVFNLGERVEGYTNFLWVAVLAGGIRLGLPPEAVAPVLGTLAGLGVFAATAWIGLRRHGRGDLLSWLAPAALALHPSFAAWSTGGLETQLFSFLLLAAAARFLVERERQAPLRWGSAALFALATLTRPEGALFAAVAGAAAAADALRRRRPLAPLVAWGALYLVPVLGHLAWRRAYYGHWLPNTFHAKVPELQWEQGIAYVAHFLTGSGAIWLLPLVAVAVFVRPGFGQALFAAWLAADAVYLILVGGDFMEFRFVVPLLPYLFLLAGDGVRRLAAGVGRWGGGRARLASAAAAVLVLAVPALYAAGLPVFPPAWSRPPPDNVSVAVTARFGAGRAAQGQALRALIDEGVLPADLRIVTGAVGALPYYTGWTTIDLRGLTDERVARTPPTDSRLAHRHRAPLSYVRERRADIVFLSHGILAIGRDQLAPQVRLSGEWLAAHNRGARSPRERLRLVCRQPLPELWMVFGTQLDDAALDRRLGPLPRCPPLPEG